MVIFLMACRQIPELTQHLALRLLQLRERYQEMVDRRNDWSTSLSTRNVDQALNIGLQSTPPIFTAAGPLGCSRVLPIDRVVGGEAASVGLPVAPLRNRSNRGLFEVDGAGPGAIGTPSPEEVISYRIR